MPSFTYTALDPRGSEQTGSVDAADLKRAAAVLGERGLFPTKVQPARTAPAKRAVAAPRFAWGRIVQPKELAVFTRQLGTLLRAGCRLLRGLEVLGKQQANPRFRRTIEALGEAIRSGSTLSGAMQAHPRVFVRIYVNMIRAGEASGALDQVLDRLAGFQEKSRQLQGRIRAALVYPAVVLAVALLILVGLLVFVVPKFKQIFADLLRGAPLPPLTQAVLAVSAAVQHHAVAAGGAGRRVCWGARVPAPHPGRHARFRHDAAARAAVWRTGSPGGGRTLFADARHAAGERRADPRGALLIARDTCGNVRVGAAILRIHDRVKEGTSVARPAGGHEGIFPPLVGSMVEVGEQTGQLDGMLNKVADIYEEEVDTAVAGLEFLDRTDADPFPRAHRRHNRDRAVPADHTDCPTAYVANRPGLQAS